MMLNSICFLSGCWENSNLALSWSFLKRSSHRVRFTQKWYGWKTFVRTCEAGLNIFKTLLLLVISFEILKLPILNAYQSSFPFSDGWCYHWPASNFYFLFFSIFPLLSGTCSLFLIGWVCSSFQFPVLAREALDVIGKKLVSHSLFLKATEENPPVLVWWNGCLPFTSGAANVENGQVESV